MKALVTAGEALATLLRVETLLSKNPNLKLAFANYIRLDAPPVYADLSGPAREQNDLTRV